MFFMMECADEIHGLLGMVPIEFKNVTVKYDNDGPEALKAINFSLYTNDLLAVVGANGSGKSTMLRCINRLVETTSGDILYFGNSIVPMRKKSLMRVRRNIGMVFQEYNLVEDLSVLDNVLCGKLGYISTLRSIVWGFSKKDVGVVLDLLERVGLENHYGKKVRELSGGQRQRVCIARALIQSPRILVLDEPTSNLDPKSAPELMGLITELSEEQNISVICSLHDINLAINFSKRMIGLKNGEVALDEQSIGISVDQIKAVYA
jgi:phosphonate transport system ATP-binding protein